MFKLVFILFVKLNEQIRLANKKNTDPKTTRLSFCSNNLWPVKPVSTFSLCQYCELCPRTAPLNIVYKYDRDSRPVAPTGGTM